MRHTYKQVFFKAAVFTAVFSGLFFSMENSRADNLFDEYYAKGQEYSAQGKLDEAEAEFTKALSIEPSNIDLYLSRAELYSKKGQLDQAVSDYSKAVEIDPARAGIYLDRGNIYSIQGKYDLAVADFSKVLGLEPAYRAEAYASRSYAYNRKGQYDLAIADADKALELSPELWTAYFNRAVAYDETGDTNKAAENYRAFLRTPSAGDPYMDKTISYAKERLEKLSAR